MRHTAAKRALYVVGGASLTLSFREGGYPGDFVPQLLPLFCSLMPDAVATMTAAATPSNGKAGLVLSVPERERRIEVLSSQLLDLQRREEVIIGVSCGGCLISLSPQGHWGLTGPGGRH